MPLYGTLTSMPLPDLLQWLCNARVTGRLRVDRDRVSKSIHLHEGRIVGCSSDDPAQRIGHFLLNRGQITEEQLREGLQLQEISGQHLGTLLVELGALSTEQLSLHLEAQAEETIHSLFDWDDAVFRFQETEKDPAHAFPVSLRVEDVLLRGVQRYDEMRQIRKVFDDPGIVLEKTDKKPPAAVIENRMGHALWELVNGERTVAEILLQVHGSEYVVTKFLFELHRSALVRIARVKEIAAHPAPAEEPVAAAAAQPLAESIAVEAEEPPPKVPEATVAAAAREETVHEPEQSDQDKFEDLLSEFNPEIDHPAAAPAQDQATATPSPKIAKQEPSPAPRETGVVSVEDSAAHTLQHNLEKARRLMAESEFEKALLKAEDLSPSEFFMLSRIDGTWDIKSIIQIAPLRESDALRTLKRLRENGLIELKDP